MNEIDSALMQACIIGDMRGAMQALTAGANPNAIHESGATPLTLASMGGSLDCARLLVSRGADPKIACQADGRTALIYAAGNGFAHLCSYLLPLSEPKARDQFGSDALQASAWGGHADCCAILATVCDPSIKDAQGLDAMDIALRSGVAECVDILRLLSSPRTEPKVERRGETTHLMMASALGDIDAIAELLPISDPWAKDPEGKDASQIAREMGQEHAAMFIDAQKSALRALANIQSSLREAKPDGSEPKAKRPRH